jgi:catechol 2,3-dioxygenase-like lactoylglutathione lyase family enzyme
MQAALRRLRPDTRRLMPVVALAAWLAWPLVVSLATSPAHAAEPAVGAVESVAVSVGDMQRSLAFYREVLEFQLVSDTEIAGDEVEHLYGVFGARVRVVRLRLGTEYLELEQFLAPGGRAMPADSRGNDRWFQHVAIIVSDMDRAYAQLREHGAQHASSGPQLLPAWNAAAGGISAFYFRDPDGHFLEVLHFPPGKGNPRWQDSSGRLFLGIDHTAIVVASTEDSLRYYRDGLGLRVAGASENYGPEQERLNNVFGARLRITALRAAAGPGIELLEYLAPRTGRPLPPDTQANDLWSWHITLRGAVAAADQVARAGHYAYISPGLTEVPGPAPGQALFMRDPDGHATLVLPSTGSTTPRSRP